MKTRNIIALGILVIFGLLLAALAPASGLRFTRETGKNEFLRVEISPPSVPTHKFFLSVQDPAPPPSQWSGAIYYDLRAKETAVVVMHPVTSFHDVLGHRGWSLDLDAFAGATTTTKAAVAGIALGRSMPLADRVTAFFGVGITGQLGGTMGGGVIASLSARF